MTRNGDWPAFPTPATPAAGTPSPFHGISKRELFALVIAHALIARGNDDGSQSVVELADVLLEVLDATRK